jgi:hypothetical protein
MSDLGTLLGQFAQPSPAGLDCAIVNTPDGNVFVIAMITTIGGRQGIWLDADGADRWATALTDSAKQARTKAAFTIAKAMPSGPTSPLPGAKGLPPIPGMPPNGHRP